MKNKQMRDRTRTSDQWDTYYLNMIIHSLYLKANLIYLKSKEAGYKEASVEYPISRSIYGKLQVYI